MARDAKGAARHGPAKQVNVRVEPRLYRALEAVARAERRSIAQTARHLLESGLRERFGSTPVDDEVHAHDIARLAREGGSFAWLDDEAELYGEDSGEPI